VARGQLLDAVHAQVEAEHIGQQEDSADGDTMFVLVKDGERRHLGF
jgi:hypothetical protein